MTSVAPDPDRRLVEILTAHRWDHHSRACACGWSQRASLGRRRAQLNHPHHVADVLSRVKTEA